MLTSAWIGHTSLYYFRDIFKEETFMDSARQKLTKRTCSKIRLKMNFYKWRLCPPEGAETADGSM